MRKSPEDYFTLLQDIRTIEPRALLEELREEDDPRFVERVWPLLEHGGRFGRILFARHLLEREDIPVMIPALNLLDDDDLLLNLIGLELLSSREVPGREGVIMDLIHHPRTEIRVVAVRLSGILRLRETLARMISIWANPLAPRVLRDECRRSIGIMFSGRPWLQKFFGWKEDEVE